MAFDSLDPFKKLRKPRRPLGTPTGMETRPRIASEEPLQRPRIVAQRPRVVSEAPTEDPNDYRSKLKPRPTFDVNGVVDPKYRTGRGSNALAGGAVGAQIGAQRNDPIFGIGATIGGMVAGLFKKNLAGKMQHQADVQEAEAFNQDLYTRTMADERIEAMRQQEQIRKQNADIALQREQRAQKTAEDKSALDETRQRSKSGMDFLKTAEKIGDPDIRRNAVAEGLTKLGIEFDPNDPNLADYGLSMKTIKAGGKFINIDKHGNWKGIVTDGNEPVSSLTPKEEIEILKEMSPDEGVNFSQALAQAEDVLIANFNDQLKPNQRNALKLQIAKQLVNEGKDKKTIFKVSNQQGNVFAIKLDQLGAPQTPVQSAGTTQPEQAQQTKPPMVEFVEKQTPEQRRLSIKSSEEALKRLEAIKNPTDDEVSAIINHKSYLEVARQKQTIDTGKPQSTGELVVPPKYLTKDKLIPIRETIGGKNYIIYVDPKTRTEVRRELVKK